MPGGYTLRDLMSEATTMSGYADEREILPSRVSWYVNAAQRELAAQLPHRELEAFASSSMSSGEDKLFLPADCEHVISLSYDTGASGVGGRGIRQASPWEFDAKSDGTQSGVPHMYLSYATWIELYPSPNSAYSILLRYQRRISDITSYDALPSLDTRYHRAVLLKTVEMLELRKREWRNAEYMHQACLRELEQMRNDWSRRDFNRSGMGLRLQKKED